MNLRGRKVYCPNCKRLVRSHAQKDNGTTSVLCNRCNKALYLWDGLVWRPLGGSD
ncbi:MAG: hypothetical protein ACE5JL_02145 [Dehalococcoidia bacterium]